MRKLIFEGQTCSLRLSADRHPGGPPDTARHLEQKVERKNEHHQPYRLGLSCGVGLFYLDDNQGGQREDG